MSLKPNLIKIFAFRLNFFRREFNLTQVFSLISGVGWILEIADKIREKNVVYRNSSFSYKKISKPNKNSGISSISFDNSRLQNF